VPAGQDDATGSAFREEIGEVLQVINRCFLEMEKPAGSAGPVEGLLRALHSLKGLLASGGMVESAHQVTGLEEVTLALGEGRLAWDHNLSDIIFTALDEIGSFAGEGSEENSSAQSRLESILDLLATERKAEDDRLLANLDPELVEVMNRGHKRKLHDAWARKVPLVEVSLALQASHFPAVVNDIQRIIESTGELLVVTGLSRIPDGFDLHYMFLALAPQGPPVLPPDQPGVASDLRLIRGPGETPEPVREAADAYHHKALEPEMPGPMPESTPEASLPGIDVPAAEAPEETQRVELVKLDRLAQLSSALVVGQHLVGSSIASLARISAAATEARRSWRNYLLNPNPAQHIAAKTEDRDSLIEMVEMTLSRLASQEEMVHKSISDAVLREDLTLDALQQLILRVRMIPMSRALEMLPRLVRDLGRRHGNRAEVMITGQETQMDRSMLEGLAGPLAFFVRYVMLYGLEDSEQRAAAGKPSPATIRISARRRGDGVAVEIKDDGRGIDPMRVKEQAVAAGLIGQREIEALQEQEILSLAFHPALVPEATSGDGSGPDMDMNQVRARLEELKGAITIKSVPGLGTTITIRTPVTLAIMQALMVEANRQHFCIPSPSVDEVFKVSLSRTLEIAGRWVMEWKGEYLPLVPLGQLLEMESSSPVGPDGQLHVVIIRSVERRLGLVVDDLVAHRDIVFGNLGTLLQQVPNVAGSTILGNGEVILTLDVAGLIRTAHEIGHVRTQLVLPSSRPMVGITSLPSILIVDDSPLVREMSRTILAGAGYQVLAAADGLEALERLRTHPVDLILSDLEMPGMDGFRLIEEVKADAGLKDIPVLILSSFDRDEYFKRASSAGAAGFLSKTAFDRGRMLDTIAQLLGSRTVPVDNGNPAKGH